MANRIQSKPRHLKGDKLRRTLIANDWLLDQVIKGRYLAIERTDAHFILMESFPNQFMAEHYSIGSGHSILAALEDAMRNSGK